MKILVLLTFLAHAHCVVLFNDDSFKIFISGTKGKLTKQKLTTKKNVEYLDISSSTVEAIEPDSFCAVPNLKALYMNANAHFPKITKQLFQCTPKISFITVDAYLESNQEFDRDAFTGLKELNFLRLNDINIGRLGKDMFEGVVNLEILNLVNCKISEIDSDTFSTMPTLDKLDLGHNLLKAFKPGTFQNLPKLTELMLNKNNIEEIKWEQWSPLQSLKSLDFGDNPLVVCDVTKIKDYFPNINRCNLGEGFNASQQAAFIEESKKYNLTLTFMNYY
ncbi:hypothetical protein HHI36_019546 [Cryptolaemus montrouzieri]|uniref:Uncharacterized protein n=1 Tax=Cryptolaemus montrouzieri TaxID=559131 RepID=A0ABD2N8T3_9CUCU